MDVFIALCTTLLLVCRDVAVGTPLVVIPLIATVVLVDGELDGMVLVLCLSVVCYLLVGVSTQDVVLHVMVWMVCSSVSYTPPLTWYDTPHLHHTYVRRVSGGSQVGPTCSQRESH